MNNLKIVLSLMTLLFISPSYGFTNTLETDDTARRVIDYFQQNDIEVRVYPPAFPALVGEMNFFPKLSKMWTLLDRDKTRIVKRMQGFESLTLSTYTTANIEQNSLTLDVNHDRGTLNRYWPLFEAKRELHRTTSVEINFGSVDMHSVSEQDFAAFSDIVEYFLSRRKQVNDLAGIISEINVRGASEYLMLAYGSMSLNEESFQDGFEHYATLLKRAAVLFRPQSKTPTEVRLGFDLDEEEQRQEFDRVIAALESESDQVHRLLTSDRVRRISIDYRRQENTYNRRLQEVRLASRGPGIEALSSHVSGIARELDLVEETGVVIFTLSDQIDENYLNGIGKVERFKNAIHEKADRIEEIRFTPYQNTRFSLGSLYINPREDDQFLADVLKGIERP